MRQTSIVHSLLYVSCTYNSFLHKIASSAIVAHPVKGFLHLVLHEGRQISSLMSIIGHQVQHGFYIPFDSYAKPFGCCIGCKLSD